MSSTTTLDRVAQSSPEQKGGTAYDPDGRRRVVLTATDRRAVDRAIMILKSVGLGVLVGCEQRADGQKPCGKVLLMEGISTDPKVPSDPDRGYGCDCTRVHFGR